jgi:Flp pilus assembly pilin Flp
LCRSYERFNLRTFGCRFQAASYGVELTDFLRNAWCQEEGRDVAEYAVVLAVILAIAIGTIKLIGANAGNVLADVGSAIQ